VPGEGAFFRDTENLVVIGSDSSTLIAALDFVLEMTHARFHHEGISADASSIGRDGYAERMLEEEAEAVISGIEESIELAQVPIATPPAPFERKYASASLMAWLRKSADAKLTVEEQTRIGRHAERIYEAEGRRGPRGRSGQAYLFIYGRVWDQVNDGE
jgi:hypothetical protein